MKTDLTKDSIQSLIQGISITPDQLSEHSLLTLQAIWKALYPRKKTPHLKTLLIREIAYHIQYKEHGALDQQSLRTLQTAKANYIRSRSGKGKSNNSKPDSNKTIPPKASHILADGAILKRQFNGRLYEVMVVIRDTKQYFLFNGDEYKSLSSIAKEITGAHWSGPRFFGLTKLKKKR